MLLKPRGLHLKFSEDKMYPGRFNVHFVKHVYKPKRNPWRKELYIVGGPPSKCRHNTIPMCNHAGNESGLAETMLP